MIETQNLTLLPQTAAHAEEMFSVLCDPALYEYENEPPISAAWLRDRFHKLESRKSTEGGEEWLNWVIRVPSGELIGYVQATLYGDLRASIAYVLSSTYWGRGFARLAVQAMILELASHYGIVGLSAVLKRSNLRSLRLLERLGFAPDPVELPGRDPVELDELRMCLALP